MKKLLVFLLASFTLTLYAADISGTWKGTADFGNGTVERTFSFKVDGKKLTGETSSQMMGKSVIADGVVDGDNVSFTITGSIQGNEVTLHYKGTVHGDEMKLNSGFNDQTVEWKLKKTS